MTTDKPFNAVALAFANFTLIGACQAVIDFHDMTVNEFKAKYYGEYGYGVVVQIARAAIATAKDQTEE